MTVTAVQKNAEALTMVLTTELDASPERVWQLWADPRQLERWWGPPTYPATFNQHDLAPGSHVAYYMTGPEGDRPHGYWEIVEADAPRTLVFRDGFANEDGSPNPEFPVTTVRSVKWLASVANPAAPMGDPIMNSNGCVLASFLRTS